MYWRTRYRKKATESWKVTVQYFEHPLEVLYFERELEKLGYLAFSEPME